MKFDKHFPTEKLRPYIKYFVVSENDIENVYKVFPTTGLVIGFQYKGQLATIHNNIAHKLSLAGITGIADSYKTFISSANTGTILAYFTATGFAHFTTPPANDLFNLSIGLDDIFNNSAVQAVEEKLAAATTDQQRILLVEQFLLSQLKHIQADTLVTEAVRLIDQSRGTIRISELNQQLLTSPSPLEKRFRKIVGTTPKKFASIVRFNAALSNLAQARSLTALSYDHHFFDQAHFIRDFKQYTGDTPERFKRIL